MPARARRPLPDDPELAALDESVRRDVATSWRSRATNELSTSTVFAGLTRCLVGVRAPLAIVREAAQAVGDEVRHAQICIDVAKAYWPHGPPPHPSAVVDELSPGCDTELATVLFAVMQSCINEGVACVYLQRCLGESRFALARAAIRDILEDEIRHARFGWAWLTSDLTDGALRGEVADALPTLLRRVADAWTAEGASPLPPVPAGHGILDRGEIAAVVRAAYDDVVIPGFEAVGIDTRGVRAWAREATLMTRGQSP